DVEHAQALLGHLVEAARTASWVVLSGSLPPGAPADWYVVLLEALAPLRARIAVDTSDDPLRHVAAGLRRVTPELLKPNSQELAQLTGARAEHLEAAAAAGDPQPCVQAARQLIDRGVGAVLATLGGAGAVLVEAGGAWYATPAPITLRSTVGAGDSSVAGYVLADVDGLDAPGRLARAVAYGSAAASMAGSSLPAPDQTDPQAVTITRVG
ncbi:MAG: PfkB family carbohydrate kinase, partial [Micrococcales bacterium]|nr:PfkB family carbohydrate kinase [Micrococcales bacterium]